MDREQLKKLRQRIDIPLQDAIRLLKQENGNIDAAIHLYRQQCIELIVEKLKCSPQSAQSYYVHYGLQFDKMLMSRQRRVAPLVVLSADIEHPAYPHIGFDIWAEDENFNEVKSQPERRYFMYLDEFNQVLDIFNSVYPQIHPRSLQLEHQFDACFDNYFDHVTLHKIILQLQQRALQPDVKQQIFITQLVECLEQKMQLGCYVVLDGNL